MSFSSRNCFFLQLCSSQSDLLHLEHQHQISRGQSSLSVSSIILCIKTFDDDNAQLDFEYITQNASPSPSSINPQNLAAYLASLPSPMSYKSSAFSSIQSAGNGNISSAGSCTGKQASSKVSFTQARSTASLPPRLQPPLAAQAGTTSAVSLNGVAGAKVPQKPPSPVPLPILQTWDLPQLGKYDAFSISYDRLTSSNSYSSSY
jgi:hypothetical protein